MIDIDWVFLYYTFLAGILGVSGYYIGRGRANRKTIELMTMLIRYITEDWSKRKFWQEIMKFQKGIK